MKMPEIVLKRKPEKSTEPASDESQEDTALILPQLKAAFTVALGSLVSGAINGWSGGTLTKLGNDFNMTTTEYSLVASLVNYGALVGSLFCGKVMDICGRRNLMLAIAPLTAAGLATMGLASNIYVVYIGRFVTGFCSGVFLSSCPIYTSETCQTFLRGRLSALSPLSLASGVFTSYLLGGFFTWRLSCFLLIAPTALFFICLCFVPESPYWYLRKGDYESASESLTRLRGLKYDNAKEMKDMLRKLSDVGTNVSYKELFNRRTFIPMAIILYVHSAQQLSGGNIILGYSSQIFESGKSSVDPQMATIYLGILQVCGILASMVVIDKYGRKVLLITSSIGCAILIIVFGVYSRAAESEYPWPSWSPVVILPSFVFCHSLGLRSIPWLIGSELLNTSARSFGNSIGVFYNRLMCGIMVQIFPYLVELLGKPNLYFTYGGVIIMFTIGTFMIVPETKGKSLEQIQDYFEMKASKKKAEQKEP